MLESTPLLAGVDEVLIAAGLWYWRGAGVSSTSPLGVRQELRPTPIRACTRERRASLLRKIVEQGTLLTNFWKNFERV